MKREEEDDSYASDPAEIVGERLRAGRLLDESGIAWRLVYHPHIERVGEGLDLNLPDLLGLTKYDLSKCLLLEDAGGKFVFLLVRALVRPDLKEVRRLVGCRRLHLASPEKVEQVLGSAQGRVSLFDLIGHKDAVSCVVLDRVLIERTTETAMHAGSYDSSICLPAKGLETVARQLCSRVLVLG